MESAREARAKHVALTVDGDALSRVFINDLADTLGSHRRGATPVCIRYSRDDASVPIRLGDEWRVRPSDDLLSRLRELAGSERVEVEYS